MHFDSALNLAWLLLGLLAFGRTAATTFNRRRIDTRKSRWLHIIGVGLIVAALFPYISATDDVLRIEHFNAQHNPRHTNKQTANDDLMRLYEAMDTALVSRICAVSLIFLFISLVFVPVVRAFDRIAPLCAGRSPPFFSAL
ncbi:MAG: hypothetical protein JOY62_05235 [Acidobacteriaceae bacterium]|nr:hypothetical protein [Acidobacteriaceae bacterium]MBV9779359.1 hypothetical protein [Acidobacteriaceae bacterium]